MCKVYKFGLKWLLLVPLALFLGVGAFGQSSVTQEGAPKSPGGGQTKGQVVAAHNGTVRVERDHSGEKPVAVMYIPESLVSGWGRSAIESAENYETRLAANLSRLRSMPGVATTRFDPSSREILLTFKAEVLKAEDVISFASKPSASTQ